MTATISAMCNHVGYIMKGVECRVSAILMRGHVHQPSCDHSLLNSMTSLSVGVSQHVVFSHLPNPIFNVRKLYPFSCQWAKVNVSRCCL